MAEDLKRSRPIAGHARRSPLAQSHAMPVSLPVENHLPLRHVDVELITVDR